MVSKPARASTHVESVETFPSETELIVAKALLLLSSKPPRIKFLSPLTTSTIRFDYKSVRKDELSPVDSKSCSSAVTSCDGSTSRVAKSNRLKVLARAAHSQDKKLKTGSEDLSPTDSKCSSTITSEISSSGNDRSDQLRVLTAAVKVIRRSRSKHYRNSNRRENLSSFWKKPAIRTLVPAKEKSTEVSLSNASSAVLALRAPSQHLIRAGTSGKHVARKIHHSPSLRRRAEVIMKFLSADCASEVRIRQVIGNTPDTSKALRMLLKLEKVKRSGAGGQKDPYKYQVAGPSSDVDSA
ncbi:hypothetical protein FRX31_017626 [Thalictrum thalictroides]|uniref:HTH three-helical bundle domain-containing protein n=1 Tax=Thalictrum thalictroides TaxID=46969 RepID=A0A7J6W6F0_THATH|nr:hypothetical protein FRX31_017626 [Thalictrum thalictroides]